MRFIIFGPPGSGKGTYASRIAPRLGIAHITTGDVLREIIKANDPLAEKVRPFVEKGMLVPDEIVIELLVKQLKKPEARSGFVLDGFPRNLDQAKALDQITHIDAVLNINTHPEVIIEKISSRRTCRNCGEIYNISDINKEIGGVKYILPPMLPKIEGRCDKCGGGLYQREDAQPETVAKRLEVYENESKPVIDYYQKKVPFVQIVANEAPDMVVEQIIKDLLTAGLVKQQTF